MVERRRSGVPAQPIQGPVELLQGAVQPQAPVARTAGHQATSLQTGQVRWRLRRSQRAWLVALASWKPQVGQEATQRPASRCSAGCSPSSAGLASSAWVVAGSWSQRWWVILAAAAHGSGQVTDAQQRSQVTAMAPSSVGVV
jgi:hypothetical protein